VYIANQVDYKSVSDRVCCMQMKYLCWCHFYSFVRCIKIQWFHSLSPNMARRYV